MIKLVHKDGNAVEALKNNEIDFLMHVVNCQGVMNSGIAKQVKQEFPENFKRYRSVYKQHVDSNQQSELLGCVLINSSVINLFAQNNYGYDKKRYLHYGAITESLSVIPTHPIIKIALIKNKKQITIGVPMLMGCDRAGGDWQVVSEMLQGLPRFINIIIYKLP